MTDPILLALLRALTRRPWDGSLIGVVADRLEELGQDVQARKFRAWSNGLVFKGMFEGVGRRARRRTLKVIRGILQDVTGIDLTAQDDGRAADEWPF